MKSSLLIITLALVGGAVAGTAAVRLAAPPAPFAPAPDRPPVSPPSRPAPGPDVALLARIDELAMENESLRERLAALEVRPLPDRVPMDELVSREQFDAFRDEILESLAKPDTARHEPAAFKAQVADTLSAIRKEEAVEKVRGYQEKRTERLEQDVGKIGEWLELTPYQTDEMRTTLLAHYEREAEQRRLWEEGTDSEILAERKRTDGEAFRTDLGHVLSPEQLETFWTRAVERRKE